MRTGRRRRHRRRSPREQVNAAEVEMNENQFDFDDDAYDTSNAVVVCKSCQTSSATESLTCFECGAVLIERLIQSAFIAGQSNDERSEENECTVCLEEKAEGDRLVALPCLHTFHAKCIAEWFVKANVDTCPLCKNRIQSDEK